MSWWVLVQVQGGHKMWSRGVNNGITFHPENAMRFPTVEAAVDYLDMYPKALSQFNPVEADECKSMNQILNEVLKP